MFFTYVLLIFYIWVFMPEMRDEWARWRLRNEQVPEDLWRDFYDSE